jgi:16S rRNA (guanine527-N7)-methyltransferase
MAVLEREMLKDTVRSVVGLRLTQAHLDAFDWYAEALLEWNKSVNLTAITAPGEIEVKHFVDSLTCLLPMDLRKGDKLVDVGTGAGFPGLPLKIVRPRLHVTLVEATAKKVQFCRHVVESLGLEGVDVLHARAEEIGQEAAHRQAYDWVVARAVASLPVLVEYLLPLVRIGGLVIAQKGETGPAEVHASEAAVKRFGGHIRQLLPVVLPTVAESRYLVLIDKVAATPEAYPRRPGVPAKRPLSNE